MTNLRHNMPRFVPACRQGAREEAVLERMRIDAEAAQAAVEEAEKRAAEYRSALTQRLEIQTQMVSTVQHSQASSSGYT